MVVIPADVVVLAFLKISIILDIFRGHRTLKPRSNLY